MGSKPIAIAVLTAAGAFELTAARNLTNRSEAMKLCLAILIATTLCAQGTVSFSGRITDSVTGLPIEQASITLDQGSYHQLLFTDAGGNFVFDEVPPGTATIKIRKENYILFETTNPDEVSFEITADRHDRNFKLTPAGRIRGKITGEGKPDEHIEVELMREDYSVGFPQYVPSGRFAGTLGPDGYFDITGLTRGRYIVRASPTSAIGPVGELMCFMQSGSSLCAPVGAEASKQREEGYTVTWYPGATTLAEATPINVNAGETQTADFKMMRRPLYSISGTVGLPDTESRQTNVILFGNGEGVAIAVSDDGKFLFHDVPPGQYTARIAGGKYQIKRNIIVTDHDVEGITLVPQPPLQVTGQFRMERADAKLPVNLSMQFGPALPSESASVEVAGNGSFVLAGFPDDYSLQPAVPHGYAVTEIRYAGINYLNQLIPLNGGASDPTLTIVLSNQPASVSGSIDRDAKSEATVVLAPWPIPENFDLRSLRIATTDKQGAFSFQGLPPGKYKAAVLTGDDRKRFRDLTILNDKFAAADVLELTAGQSANITPKP